MNVIKCATYVASAHPETLPPLVLAFTLLALLCCELICNVAELAEKVLLIRRDICPIHMGLFAVSNLEDVVHACGSA